MIIPTARARDLLHRRGLARELCRSHAGGSGHGEVHVQVRAPRRLAVLLARWVAAHDLNARFRHPDRTTLRVARVARVGVLLYRIRVGYRTV